MEDVKNPGLHATQEPVAVSEYLPGEHAAQSGKLSLSHGFSVSAATLNHVMVASGSEDAVSKTEHKHTFESESMASAFNAQENSIIEHAR